jgi:hypothetical protein
MVGAELPLGTGRKGRIRGENAFYIDRLKALGAGYDDDNSRSPV